ncbi:MAG: hypothetical protein ABSF22_22805 [Bryobacteraceae bacterium]
MRFILMSALLTASLFAQHRGGSVAPAPRPRPAPPISYRPYYPTRVVAPYPIFVGGYYSGYAPAAGYDNGYTDQAPVAVVNQDFRPDGGNQQIVDYSALPVPEATDDSTLKDDQPTIFLIALTDHTVVAAIAYWVDGDTLHWVSREAQQNHMSLSLVDRDFSKQLNDERHVEFKLPAPK